MCHIVHLQFSYWGILLFHPSPYQKWHGRHNVHQQSSYQKWHGDITIPSVFLPNVAWKTYCTSAVLLPEVAWGILLFHSSSYPMWHGRHIVHQQSSYQKWHGGYYYSICLLTKCGMEDILHISSPLTRSGMGDVSIPSVFLPKVEWKTSRCCTTHSQTQGRKF